MPGSGVSVSKDLAASVESAKPQPASTGGAVAGTANTIDVASSASTPADNAISTGAAQSENKPTAVDAVKEASKSDTEGAASNNAAPADFSSFLTANKQQSPFAVKAGTETSAFGSGNNVLTFGNAQGGFGAIGQHVGSLQRPSPYDALTAVAAIAKSAQSSICRQCHASVQAWVGKCFVATFKQGAQCISKCTVICTSLH